MNIEYIDTEKLKEYGNNILESANNIKNNLDYLHERINNINSKTFEWIGNESNDFIDKFNNDYNNYNDIYLFIKEYGNLLIDCSNKVDDSIKKVFYD